MLEAFRKQNCSIRCIHQVNHMDYVFIIICCKLILYCTFFIHWCEAQVSKLRFLALAYFVSPSTSLFCNCSSDVIEISFAVLYVWWDCNPYIWNCTTIGQKYFELLIIIFSPASIFTPFSFFMLISEDVWKEQSLALNSKINALLM